MENNILSQAQINMILDDKYNNVFWTYQLGLVTNSKENKTDNYLSSNFYERGAEFWEDILDKVKHILCDESNNAPKKEIAEVLDDQKTNIVVYLITLVTSQLEVVIGIAIPIVALVLKKGLNKLCVNN